MNVIDVNNHQYVQHRGRVVRFMADAIDFSRLQSVQTTSGNQSAPVQLVLGTPAQTFLSSTKAKYEFPICPDCVHKENLSFLYFLYLLFPLACFTKREFEKIMPCFSFYSEGLYTCPENTLSLDYAKVSFLGL